MKPSAIILIGLLFALAVAAVQAVRHADDAGCRPYRGDAVVPQESCR